MTDVIWQSLSQAPPWLIVGLVLLLMVSPLIQIASYFFAVAVGSEAWINRLGTAGPVLMWVALYMATQFAVLAGSLLPIHLVWPDGDVQICLGFVNVFTAGRDNLVPLGIFIVLVVSNAAVLWHAVVSYDRRLDLR